MRLKGFIPRQINKNQARDTGMAMVLITLVAGYANSSRPFLLVSIVLLIIDMTWPSFYKPAAKVWLGFSNILGELVSKVILTLLFLLIVTPIGVVRRLTGKDSMQLKKWKNNDGSVFKERNHTFTASDLEQPY